MPVSKSSSTKVTQDNAGVQPSETPKGVSSPSVVQVGATRQQRFPIPPKHVVIGVIVCSIAFVVCLSIFSASRQSLSLSGESVRVTKGIVSSADYYAAPSGVAMGGRGMQVNYAFSESMPPVVVTSVPTPINSPEPSTENLPTERKVIKNGNLALIVHDVDTGAAYISGLAGNAGGFVESTMFTEYTKGVKTGVITIRVPGEQFDSVMANIKSTAVRVQSENSNAQDVSAQYVDLEANLTSQKAEEEQYLQIMKRAGEIKDVLAVSERLADVRRRIEQTQGQMNYLSRQTAMSTISVTLSPEANPVARPTSWRPLSIAKEALTQLVAYLVAFVNLLITLVIWLPAILLQLGVFVLILWGLWKIAVIAMERLTGVSVTNPFKKN